MMFFMDRVYSYMFFHILSEYYDMFVNANLGFETLRCLEKVPTIFSQMVEFAKSHLQQIQDMDFGRPLAVYNPWKVTNIIVNASGSRPTMPF